MQTNTPFSPSKVQGLDSQKSGNVIIICGPTGSGKSELALSIAKRQNGVIVNCDSAQVYKELVIITASPTKEEKLEARHLLYNYFSLSDHYSLGKYIDKFISILNDYKNLIIVGGTGMYINALINGIHYIPPINPEIKAKVTMSTKNIYELLKDCDPLSAKVLHPKDTQRIQRAYQVFLQTGKSICSFYKNNLLQPLSGYKIQVVMLSPEKQFLHHRCDQRFLKFIKNGAIEEVSRVMQFETKILGVHEIKMYLTNQITLQEAIKRAQLKTRQYIKKQFTWFKNQLPTDAKILSFANELEFHKILRRKETIRY